ncbi:TPA: tRNA pseudouridine(54/55) synthase Pus10 [Candidatus Bathyarchaeota archaeon]|nr:tRNA pseudouridine(54/55) synthase Pus10 [Candidatus Bathyarchaeota archaeon]
MDILEMAQRMIEENPLCDNCLGRQFAFLGYGMENRERGQAIKILLTMKGHKLALLQKPEGFALLRALAENGGFRIALNVLRKLGQTSEERRGCFLCGNRFDDLSPLVEKAVDMLREYEYDTFLVGVRIPSEIEEREDELRAKFRIEHGESMRNEFSRVIGKMLLEVTGKKVDYMKPQIVVLFNPFTEEIELQVNSLFIMGRYRKLVRGIPQSKWFCRRCRGRGCPSCNWTGKMYPESVEELIAKPILEMTLGEGSSFHGAGREDIDARMLGMGRPFVMEIKKPRKRRLDLSELEHMINERAKGKIGVLGLKYVDREAVVKIKDMESTQKTYQVTVEFEREIRDEEIEKLRNALTDITVLQQTPTRVLHRRADLTREKHIYETKIKRISPNRIELIIKCQGGLYVKELVTGDNGRTKPNISQIIGMKAQPLELDVLSVLEKMEEE